MIYSYYILYNILDSYVSVLTCELYRSNTTIAELEYITLLRIKNENRRDA